MTIDPLDFNPLAQLDYQHAYLMCTWHRAQYASEDQPSWLAAVHAIAGVTSVETFGPISYSLMPNLQPQAELAQLGAGQGVLVVRGTTAFRELVNEILFSPLHRAGPEWPGSVSTYFQGAARLLLNAVGGSLPARWLSSGHSLGGSLAALLARAVPGQEAEHVFSAGAPRAGDANYSTAQPAETYLRLTTAGDLAPAVPPGTNTVLDYLPYWIPWPVIPIYYRHWGIRKHLWPDGSLTLPPGPDATTPAQLADILAENLAFGLWVENHYASTYCERLRRGIPLRFPASADVDFPAVEAIDSINAEMNDAEGRSWDIDGRGGRLPTAAPSIRLEDRPDVFTFRCE